MYSRSVFTKLNHKIKCDIKRIAFKSLSHHFSSVHRKIVLVIVVDVTSADDENWNAQRSLPLRRGLGLRHPQDLAQVQGCGNRQDQRSSKLTHL